VAREDHRRPPRLSVVLPVLNEVEDLGALLDQLLRQAGSDGMREILVVDGGSTDGTRELVRERMSRRSPLRLLENPHRRSGPARNRGIEAARGEFVLFLDGHCILPSPDYLDRVEAVFEASGADCLCRPQPLDRVGATGPWGRAIAAARHARFGHNPGSDIYATEAGHTDPESAGAAYRRVVFDAIGGYDERFDACEDVEFNHRVNRAGFRSYRHPDLAVAYRPRETPGRLWKQMWRYGRGRAHLLARHRDMVPWILVALTAACPVWGVSLILSRGALFPVILLGPLLLYAGLCVFEARRAMLGDSWLRAALIFPVIHAGLLLGFWRGLAESFYFFGGHGSARPGKMTHGAAA